MPDCSILTNHGQSQAPAVVCDGCYRLAMTSIRSDLQAALRQSVEAAERKRGGQ